MGRFNMEKLETEDSAIEIFYFGNPSTPHTLLFNAKTSIFYTFDEPKMPRRARKRRVQGVCAGTINTLRV